MALRRISPKISRKVLAVVSILAVSIFWLNKSSYEQTDSDYAFLNGNLVSITTKYTDENTNHRVPGQYNLIEEAVLYNGGLRRPPKECSIGELPSVKFHSNP